MNEAQRCLESSHLLIRWIERGGLSWVRSLALKILERKHPKIDKVILGHAHSAELVVEIVSMPAQ